MNRLLSNTCVYCLEALGAGNFEVLDECRCKIHNHCLQKILEENKFNEHNNTDTCAAKNKTRNFSS